VKTLDLSEQKVVDVHCFAFSEDAKNLTKEKLYSLFWLGGPTVGSVKSAPVEQNEVEECLNYKLFIKFLSKFLKCEKHQVLLERNKRCERFQEYLDELFSDAKIEEFVFDSGLKTVKDEELKRYFPRRYQKVFRLEPLISELLENSKSLDELLQRFEQTLERVLSSGYKGFKSVIAYRSGLDVQSWSRKELEEEFVNRKLEWFGPVVKKIRDELFITALKVCAKRRAMLQIHTGLGDTDVVAEKCNPILLKGVLMREEFWDAKVVLVHGGYPFLAEACWLSKVFPNVYVETSSPFPQTYIAPLSVERFYTVLGSAPLTKIVYGSDAFEIPELHWIAAKLTKLSLEVALSKMIELGVLDEEEAYRSAKMVLYQNAHTLLG
jgi:predicted TIM-barrel fold metal-dependent hydrolase